MRSDVHLPCAISKSLFPRCDVGSRGHGLVLQTNQPFRGAAERAARFARGPEEKGNGGKSAPEARIARCGDAGARSPSSRCTGETTRITKHALYYSTHASTGTGNSLFGSLLWLACIASGIQAAAGQALNVQGTGVWLSCSAEPGSREQLFACPFSALTVSQSSHDASALMPAGARLPRNENETRFLGARLGGAVCMPLARLRRSSSQPNAAPLHPVSQGQRETGNQTGY